jgi:hypothetical protein
MRESFNVFVSNEYNILHLGNNCDCKIRKSKLKLENFIPLLMLSEFQPPRHYFILLTYESVDRDAWVDKQSTFFHPYLQDQKKWIDPLFRKDLFSGIWTEPC